MKKTGIWYSDIHLDHCEDLVVSDFYKQLSFLQSDFILITGDISTSKSTQLYITLKKLAEAAGERDVYFVLGNHDFWHSSIPAVKSFIERTCQSIPNLSYLSCEEPILLSDDFFLIGQDGSHDLRTGELINFNMKDYKKIQDLRMPTDESRKRMISKIATRENEAIDQKLNHAKELGAKEILLATHVPPYRETAIYNGRLSDERMLPFYVNTGLGELLDRFATLNPEIQIGVVCGHTHGRYSYQKHPNLTVRVAMAEYGNPRPEMFLNLEAGKLIEELNRQEIKIQP